MMDKFAKKTLLEREEYKFIKDIPDIILLSFGGSIAYGTDLPGSDIDLRGIMMNPQEELLGMEADFGQKVFSETDTVIYSFKKMLGLLMACNPNTVEILGADPEDVLIATEAGKMLLDNKDIFLSKRAYKTFGGYALSQLNRLENRSGRALDAIAENEKRSFIKAFSSFSARHRGYVDESAAVVEKDGQLFVSMEFKDMPVTQASAILNEINDIDKNYRKSARNDKAVSHGKIAKHMMHLIRLFLMGRDILAGDGIVTKRTKEHDLLMSIRRGDYLEADGVTPTKAFNELREVLAEGMRIAYEHSPLPEEPDRDRINRLAVEVNRMYLEGRGL